MMVPEQNDERGALLLVMIDVEPAHERDFNRWYEEEHLPERIGLPGFRTAKRYRLVSDAGPRYLALYEIDGPDALQTPEYRALVESKSEWTTKVESTFSFRLRAVYADITPEQ